MDFCLLRLIIYTPLGCIHFCYCKAYLTRDRLNIEFCQSNLFSASQVNVFNCHAYNLRLSKNDSN